MFPRHFGFVAGLLLMALQACRGDSNLAPAAAPRETGEVQIHFGNLKAMSIPITDVIVTSTPSGVSKAMPMDSNGNFSGTMVLPVGLQSFTAIAYGNGVSAASGSALALVSAQTVALVVIQLQDNFLLPPAPDRGPIILSVIVSNAAPQMGEAVTMTVSARDADGDPITYAWSTDCADSPFAQPASDVTTWSSPVSQVCEINVEAQSRSLSDIAAFSLIVYAGTGSQGGAQISGTFFPAPDITSLYFKNASGTTLCTINRTDPDAACRVPVAPGEQVQFRIQVDFRTNLGSRTHGLTDDCDGEPSYDKMTTGSGNVRYLYYYWTAPLFPQVCGVTPEVFNSSAADRLPIAILVR